MKRKYKRNIERLRRTQGCLTDCVAYFLNIHPESVPYFVYPRKDWNKRLRKFFNKHGYDCKWRMVLTETPSSNYYKIPKNGRHIIVGDSIRWKTASHAVVYQNGKLAYDPNYPSQWKHSRITHRLVMYKTNGK